VVFGVLSLAALSGCSDDQKSSRVSHSTRQELSPSMVQQVQTSLQQQGLYSGTVDGIWGPVTQTAVQRYQRANGLSVNGQIDSPTLASLNLANDGTLPAGAAPPQQVAAPLPAPPTATPPVN
jgi:peptidoglycan hydrolase-like protein with peptidoglycan-binding domain